MRLRHQIELSAVINSTLSNRMGTRLKDLLLVAFACVCLSPQHARSQTAGITKIELDWEEILDRVSPALESNIRVARHVSLALNGGKKIDTATSNISGKYQNKFQNKATLGEAWHVGSGNTLVRTDVYPHHVRIVTVQVQSNSCSLSVNYELKNGFKNYTTTMLSRPGQMGIYSRIAASNPRCSIV